MRTDYKNGDSITLQATGCDGCSPSMVSAHSTSGKTQMVICHELNCPDAWRDYPRDCRWCGSAYYPTDREQAFCGDDCAQAYNS